MLVSVSLTPWLTGAGARSAEGTDIGHQNREAMAYVGVRVEPPVRLGRVGTVLQVHIYSTLLGSALTTNNPPKELGGPGCCNDMHKAEAQIHSISQVPCTVEGFDLSRIGILCGP